MACQSSGSLGPYTKTILDNLSSRLMTPYDWIQVTKACLSGGNILLWKAEFEAKTQVSHHKKTGHGHITLNMLLGEGEFYTAQAQMHPEKEVLLQVTSCAVNAWTSLPATTEKTSALGEVKQTRQKL